MTNPNVPPTAAPFTAPGVAFTPPPPSILHSVMRQIEQQTATLPRYQYAPLKQKVQYARAVTTCAAAFCERARAIVVIADERISYGVTSTRGEKIWPVHRDWHVLYAGFTAPSLSVLRDLRATMDHRPKTLADVEERIVALCRQYPCRILKDGTREQRQFLLAGFDPAGVSHLVLFTDEAEDSAPIIEPVEQFAAIGTGEQIVRHLLALFDQHSRLPAAVTLYHCCAAKFFSEALASDIGKATTVYLLRQGAVDFRPTQLLRNIRSAWKRRGQLPVPPAILAKLQKDLDIT